MTGPHWTSDDIADQSGRRMIITGGNSGIGFEAARMLAGAGARIGGGPAHSTVLDTHLVVRESA